MSTDWRLSADSAKFRGDMYGLLAAVFRKEPGESLIRALRDSRLVEVFLEMNAEFDEDFYTMPESELIEVLGIEFTRLFIVPEGKISAHETIFTELDHCVSAIWGSKTVEVKNFIKTTGLNYDDAFTGILDHVSVELEIMHKLADWEAEKWNQQDDKGARYGQSVQQKFLNEYLFCWIPLFCDEVIYRAEIPFYRVMAELTRNYLIFDQRFMEADLAA